MLKKADILTQENTTAVTTHIAPITVAHGMCRLNRAGILTQSNRTAITAHSHPRSVVKMIRNLNRGNILTQASFNAITAHVDPPAIANAIRDLSQANILTESNFNVVITDTDNDIIRATFNLNWADILTQANFTVVSTHTSPSMVVVAIDQLNDVGILTQRSFDVVTAHTDLQAIEGVTRAIVYLNFARILTKANATIITAHTNPLTIADAIDQLDDIGMILTQANFNAITTSHSDPLAVVQKLCAQKRARLPLPKNLLTYTQSIEQQEESFPDTFEKLGIESDQSIECTITHCVPRIPVLLNSGNVPHLYDLNALKRLINPSNFTGENPMDRSHFT